MVQVQSLLPLPWAAASMASSFFLPVPAPAKTSPRTEAVKRSGSELSPPRLAQILHLRKSPQSTGLDQPEGARLSLHTTSSCAHRFVTQHHQHHWGQGWPTAPPGHPGSAEPLQTAPKTLVKMQKWCWVRSSPVTKEMLSQALTETHSSSLHA